jgi:hypothetical protein
MFPILFTLSLQEQDFDLCFFTFCGSSRELNCCNKLQGMKVKILTLAGSTSTTGVLLLIIIRARQRKRPGMHRSLRGLLCCPEYQIQPKFHSPVPLIKRQRSFTVAVRMSVGSTTSLPKTL